ncbi:hypothetical protein BU26DRAFT_506121 [Trematosphaeria pertusa]|uniref:Uncharacterized protein n=1 Tax=Trematosphaeria pertusa TaxID=390896 RepID=A0A6A6IEC0_9PLEO|nr:uncharacterized protein BU26DRAFT_506121 [Trematosphaeria pertusa]KAF2248408.1 hypothetical protein BU26DRAFT_506121 [Trematosphaeria pertusa]
MAGYGNRNAPDLTTEESDHLGPQHSETRFGRDDSHAYSNPHEKYGSAATAGAGFGNKSAPDNTENYDNSDLRFGSHQDTAPYSGSTQHGSGTVGGAGYGNKTGGFAESKDSTLGKLMEKAGHVMHNEGLAEKGRTKREAQGFGQGES